MNDNIMAYEYHCRPCPFCGAEHEHELQIGTEDREGIPTAILCGNCGAVGPWQYFPRGTIEEAVWKSLSQAWNGNAP